MESYHFRKAQPRDNAQLRALVSAPMPGDIAIAFRREPDYFTGARVQYENCEIYVCEHEEEEIVALFSIGTRRLWVNGKICSVRYFSDVRIDPGFRKSSVLYRMVRFMERKQFLEGQFAQTIVFSSNQEVLRILEKKYRLKEYQYFNYFPLSSYYSYMISLGRVPFALAQGLRVERAQEADKAAMQAFHDREAPRRQFYPAYDFDRLGEPYYEGLHLCDYFLVREQGEIVGMAALWDQKAFKQTQVESYAGRIKHLRPLINLYGKITGGFQLPKAGEPMRYANLHHLLIRDDREDIFRSLLHTMVKTHQSSGWHYLLCGLDEQDPLRATLAQIRHKRILRGEQFLVAYDEVLVKSVKGGVPYLEVGRI